MKNEQEKNSSPSPYERIKSYFDIAPEQKKEGIVSFNNPYRYLKLEDGTRVEFKNGWVNGKSFVIWITPSGREKNNPAMDFTIDDVEGLTALSISNISIKVGTLEFENEKLAAHLKFNETFFPESSKRDKLSMGKIMVDWFDKLIEEKKYSNPPITASIFK